MPRIHVHTTDLESPLRVDQFLAARKGAPSRSGLKKLFDQGRVLVNGKPAKPSTRLHPGDVIEAELAPPEPADVPAEPIPLEVIFEDKHLIVIDKPAGMTTHPTPNSRTGTLVNALLHHCQDLSGVGGKLKPGIVHRLDKMTSGVMVAAKNDLAHQGLALQFKSHTIDRKYLALAWGEFRDLSGRIEGKIGRSEKNRLKMTTRARRGRSAVTHYKVLARARGFTMVECILETGRTHQIRVHLSESGHPVVGDPLYGKGRNLPSGLEPEQRAALDQLKRQALHAYRLGFTHPHTKEKMAFESPLPPDITRAAKALDLMRAVKITDVPGRVE